MKENNPGETLSPWNINVLKYSLSMTKLDNERFIANIINELPTLEGDIMTAADQLRQEGRQEGAAQAAQETARKIATNLLMAGDDVKRVAKTTKLSLSEVKKLAKEAKNDTK